MKKFQKFWEFPVIPRRWFPAIAMTLPLVVGLPAIAFSPSDLQIPELQICWSECPPKKTAIDYNALSDVEQQLTPDEVGILRHLAFPQRRASLLSRIGYPYHADADRDYYRFGELTLSIVYNQTTAIAIEGL